MSKDKISDYSATANSNTDIGGINIDEGCAPSGINDAIRTLMKQLKDFQQGTNSDPFNGPHNGTVGATTPASGAFTTLSASSTLSVTGAGTIQGLTVGKGAGAVSTNTAVGASALASNSTGGNTVAVGYRAANASTGSAITAVGTDALRLTTADRNTAVGRSALEVDTTGTVNTAVGFSALSANTTGSYNTALGDSSLASNTTASNNTAVGYQAGYSNTTGANNTTIGSTAGYSLTTSGYNTMVGERAGTSTTGVNNTFIGQEAGNTVTSGTKNTIIGRYNGNQGGLDIRTSSNYIVLSDGDGNPRASCDNAALWNFPNFKGTWYGNAISNSITWDGAQIYPTTDNAIKLGYPTNRWTTVYATTGTINTSDANQKQDIAALDDAEKRVATVIKSLIKKYRFRDAVAEKGDVARIHVGAVAQEVQAAFVAEGLDPKRYGLFCSDTWYEVDGKPSPDLTNPYTAETESAVEVTRLGLRYEELLAFVIAAM